MNTKNNLLQFFPAVALLLFSANPIAAQNQQGQVAINAGAGYSIMTEFVNPYEPLSEINYINRYPIGPAFVNAQFTKSESIVYSGSIDYALAHVFSLGLACGYQTVDVHWTNWYNTETGNYENFDETLSRLNIGLRMLGHMGITSNSYDIYAGFRVGYSQWTDANNSNDTAFKGSKSQLSWPSFQVLIGFRGYFTSFMGIHLELAVGTPYFAEAGLTFKFGGKKTDNAGNNNDPNDPYTKERRARDAKNAQPK